MKKSRLLGIFLVVFVDLLGFGLILPLLPFYAESYGASATLVGLLVASYALAQFFGAPLLGRLSDRYGRRPILMVSILGTVVGFLMLGFAEPLGKWLADTVLGALFTSANPITLRNIGVVGVMFFSRLLDGFTGGNITVAQAYITDITDAKNRAKGLGLIGAAFGLGFILGPAVGGVLSQWGYAVPAFAAAGLATLNLTAIFFLLPESLTAERRAELTHQPRRLISISAMWQALTRPRVGPLMHIRLLYSVASALFQTMFTLWAKDRLGLSAQSTAYLLAYVGLLAVLVQGVAIGRLAARFTETQLIFWSAILLTASLLLWAFVPSVPALMLVLIPMALSTGVLNTVVNSAITRVVRPEEIGGALGVSASLESLSRIISPVLGGFLLGNVGTWAPGVVAAAIMAWVVSFVWRRLIVNPDPPLPGGGEQLAVS
jgi:DHA1 family tetracycline resistance protein-like MFS transporter